MRHLPSLVLSTFFLTACGSTDHDTPIPDLGPPLDLGRDATTGVDARADIDTGTPDVDATLPPVDSGMMLGTCGTCPTGTSCGSANGIAVCRTAEGVPQFSHVFVIVMENTSLSTLTASTNTPYLHSLFAMYASSSNYHGVTHPSMPNYIAMTSGASGVGSIGCDCQPTGSMCSAFTCNALLGSCGCPQSVMHIGDQLEAAGLGWKDYAEDIGSTCNVMAAGSYAPKHVPFLYYPNVQTDAARCAAHVVDHADLAGDLAGSTPTYAFISPNLTHDMHDPFPAGAMNLANGDGWLSTEVPSILASTAYTSGGLLVIVWDEDDLSGTLAPDDPVPMILLSPYALTAGFTSSVRADHSSLLATIEDGLGLARLGSAVTASPLTDFFPVD